MPNIRLKLEGQVFGCLEVLRWDESSYGKHDSKWFVRCRNCSSVKSNDASKIKKCPKSCIECKMLHRVYPQKARNCPGCGSLVSGDSRHGILYCSDECRKSQAAFRVMKDRRTDIKRTLVQLTSTCRSRDKKRGRDSDITVDYILGMLDSQKGLCAKTKRVMKASIPSDRGRHQSCPNTVSIDRIDSTKGYEQGNVQLVVYQYNVGKNSFSDKEFLELCRQVVEQEDMSYA